jgi:hypothetical protein
MVRQATQLFILSVLFFLLASGGRVTLCDVLSVVGLEVHHHASKEGRGSGAPCLQSHDHHDEAPCPESCEIEFSEAAPPIVLKIPALAVAYVLPSRLEARLADAVPRDLLRTSENLEPPDGAVSLIDPAFTGRFLV